MDEHSNIVAAALTQAGEFLDQAAGVLDGFDKETKDNRPQLYRAEHAAASGRALVGVADPSIVPTDFATEVRDQSATLRDQVQLASDDGSGDIGGSTEALLVSLMRIRQPNAALEEKAREAAVRFRQSLDPRLRAVASEVDSVQIRLGEVVEATSSQTTEVTERINELRTETDAAKERVDGLIGEQDTKFNDAQEERRKEFAASLAAANSDLSNVKEGLETRRDQAVERIEQIEEELAATAAALGGRAAAMGHGDESDEQAKRAFRWSVAAIALLLAAAVIPIRAGILDADQSPESVAGKAVIALILAGVAGYAAGIGRHHRERAASARRLELEMASFGPFIAPLDPKDQKDLRGAIVWRFYGEQVESQEPDGPPRPGLHIREFLSGKRNARGDGTPLSIESPPAAE